jgi:acyl carrier protein
MRKEEIIKSLNNIFIEVLDNEKIILSETTTADDIDGWDSLSHIQLVVAIEKHFKIRFTSSEIRTWENVNQMVESIVSKI